MHQTSDDRRIRTLIAWLLAMVFFDAPFASAEIFKCVEKGGLERYQNFPCSIDSLGSLPSSLSTSATALPPGVAKQAQLSAVAGNAASTGRSTNAGEPRVGMTKDEVTASWGEPEEMLQDEPRQGRIEIWRYADGRSVQFNNKHRAVAVQR